MSSAFPYEVAAIGRRQLEAMPLVRRDHFGEGEPHPGAHYHEGFAAAVTVQTN